MIRVFIPCKSLKIVRKKDKTVSRKIRKDLHRNSFSGGVAF